MQLTLDLVRAHQSFLLVTHDFPDGDGLGSQMALYQGLKALGKKAYAINPAATPEKFALVDPAGEITVYQPGKLLPEVDAVFILDTNELKMMGPMEPALRTCGRALAFIDHHEREATPPGAHFIDERFAATGELVYTLLKALGVELDAAMATALYVAIVTDTAGFRYKRTSPQSHRIAAELLEMGVAPETVYRSIYARESLSKTRLLGKTLESVQTDGEGRIAWVSVSRADRTHYGATVEDTESFVAFLTLVDGVEIAALFREDEDGSVKVSLRGLGTVPVIEIARGLGGGGHRYAAGARVNAPMAEVVQRVLGACRGALDVRG